MRTFSYGKNIYSVDMMFAYINMFKPKYVKVDVVDYIKTLDFPVWKDNKKSFSPKDVLANPKKYADHYKRIKNVDLNYPIIIANNTIVDGVHRLTKCYIQKKKNINVYIFDKPLLKKFLLDKNKNYHKVKKLTVNDLIELFYSRF